MARLFWFEMLKHVLLTTTLTCHSLCAVMCEYTVTSLSVFIVSRLISSNLMSLTSLKPGVHKGCRGPFLMKKVDLSAVQKHLKKKKYLRRDTPGESTSPVDDFQYDNDLI